MAALLALVSCQKDGKKFSNKDIIGEWKAVKLEVSFDSGRTLTITNEAMLEDELAEMYWISVSENNIRSLSADVELLIPYEINDNQIVFTGGEKGATYELESVSASEMLIRYTGGWTSLITYKKKR